MRSAELAQLYHELARLLRSGLTLSRAAETLERGPLPSGSRDVVRQIRTAAAKGDGLASALADLPSLDRAVVSAGEASGHLDRTLDSLASYHQSLARVRATMLRRAAYPLFLVHFGALILALPRLFFGGGPGRYALDVALTLGGVYVVLAVVIAGASALIRGATVSTVVERVLSLIPVLGSTRRNFGVARFCMAYGTGLAAGIPVVQALRTAGAVSKSASIQKAVQAAIPKIQRGEAAAPLLADALPESVVRGLVVGEETGTLDEELARWSELHLEKATAGLEVLGEWIPKLLYLGVAGLLAWRIIEAYQVILSGYARALDF